MGDIEGPMLQSSHDAMAQLRSLAMASAASISSRKRDASRVAKPSSTFGVLSIVPPPPPFPPPFEVANLTADFKRARLEVEPGTFAPQVILARREPFAGCALEQEKQLSPEMADDVLSLELPPATLRMPQMLLPIPGPPPLPPISNPLPGGPPLMTMPQVQSFTMPPPPPPLPPQVPRRPRWSQLDPVEKTDKGALQCAMAAWASAGTPLIPGVDPEDPNSFQVLEIPDEVTGMVIGKAGSRIQSIQADTNTAIKVGKLVVDGKRRICIMGDAEGQENAVKRIQSLVDHTSTRDRELNVDTKVEHFEVPQFLTGSIIGKNGCKLHTMEKTFVVAINVKPIPELDTTNPAVIRGISIRGNAQCVERAKEHVNKLLLEGYRRMGIYNAELEASVASAYEARRGIVPEGEDVVASTLSDVPAGNVALTNVSTSELAPLEPSKEGITQCSDASMDAISLLLAPDATLVPGESEDPIAQGAGLSKVPVGAPTSMSQPPSPMQLQLPTVGSNMEAIAGLHPVTTMPPPPPCLSPLLSASFASVADPIMPVTGEEKLIPPGAGLGCYDSVPGVALGSRELLAEKNEFELREEEVRRRVALDVWAAYFAKDDLCVAYYRTVRSCCYTSDSSTQAGVASSHGGA